MRQAIRETKSRRTLAFEFAFRGSQGFPLSFEASGTADFASRREGSVLTVEKLSGVKEGTRIFGYSDPSGEYIRLQQRAQYQRIPKGEQSPIANGVTDSFERVALDTKGGYVRGGSSTLGGAKCTRYRSKLDGEKIAERAEEGREGEAADRAAVIDGAPVSVCIDADNLVRGLDFSIKIPKDGRSLRVTGEFSKFGTAKSPKRPRGI